MLPGSLVIDSPAGPRQPSPPHLPEGGLGWGIVRVAPLLVVALVLAGLLGAAPSASADKIVFTRIKPTGHAVGLVVMRPSGRVVSVVRWFVENDYDVSLDGRRVVLSDDYLLTIPFTDRGRLAAPRVRVLTRSTPGYTPQVSPNGRFVAGARGAGGRSQIFVVRVPGGRARRLRTSAALSEPSWSPDGRRIVASDGRGLWVLNVARGGARKILSSESGEIIRGPRGHPMAAGSRSCEPNPRRGRASRPWAAHSSGACDPAEAGGASSPTCQGPMSAGGPHGRRTGADSRSSPGGAAASAIPSRRSAPTDLACAPSSPAAD